MSDYIVKRALTHEQVWIIRDEAKRGVLNMKQRAQEWHVSPTTIAARRKSDPIYYPIFETLEHAKLRDSLASLCAGDLSA